MIFVLQLMNLIQTSRRQAELAGPAGRGLQRVRWQRLRPLRPAPSPRPQPTQVQRHEDSHSPGLYLRAVSAFPLFLLHFTSLLLSFTPHVLRFDLFLLHFNPVLLSFSPHLLRFALFLLSVQLAGSFTKLARVSL